MKRIAGLLIITCVSGQIIFADFTNRYYDAKDELFQKLLELQQGTCGNESAKWKGYIYPVPCCIPCDCLPHCDSVQKYCPFEAVANGDDKRTTHPAGNKTSIKNYEQSPLVLKNQSDSPIATVGPQNETMVEKTGVEFPVTCIRPQIYLKTNLYLDSQAYEMVVSCPVRSLHTSVYEKCKAGFQNKRMIDSIPVTSNSTGITYSNKYCLICNELETNGVLLWVPIFISVRRQHQRWFVRNPHTILEDLVSVPHGSTNIIFQPPPIQYARPCQKLDIIKCNQTGLWEVFNNQLDDICRSGPNIPIIHKINQKNKIFKNIACVHCNLNDKIQDIQCYSDSLSDNSRHYYSMRMNTNAIVGDDIHLPDTVYMNTTPLESLKSHRCPKGFVYIKNRCRKISCPRDHVISNSGRCMPLYDLLTGMRVHIMLKIIVSSAVGEASRTEFTDIIEGKLYSTIDQTTSLQPFDVKLWYLSISKSNPGEYYVFDIYLINSSKEISFTKVLTEVYHLFNRMKTYHSIMLGTGREVQLQYDFAHDISTSRSFLTARGTKSSGRLALLTEISRTSDDGETYIPSMFISDANWCYRTVLEEDEIEFYGSKDYRIKGTDIFLYSDQIDSADIKFLYVCIDFLLKYEIFRPNHLNAAFDDRPVKTSEQNTEEEEAPWYFSQLMVFSSCIIASVLFCTLFHYLRSRIKNEGQMVAKDKLSEVFDIGDPHVGRQTVNNVVELSCSNKRVLMRSYDFAKEFENDMFVVDSTSNERQNVVVVHQENRQQNK